MPPSTFQGKTLYPFQKKAIAAVDGGRSVIVAAPTGAGKTLVADYAIEHAFMEGRRIVYTAPVKALSNQKFRDFRGLHGDDVGIMTGDVTINPEAPLLIMTTEVFRNTIFESPKRLEEVSFVIFDEVHYIDDKERGTVWEESILYAPSHIRIIALSATIPNIEQLAGWIRKTRGSEIDVVLAAYLPFAEVVQTETGSVSVLPDCRDPDDQKFLYLAHVGEAEVLVTGDSDLLSLAQDVAFRILSPAQFHRRLVG